MLALSLWESVKWFLTRLYHLILQLGGPGLFFLAVADSSFLSVPEGNDFLIIVLSTGNSWERMSYYVMMTVMGSVTGCSLLYLVGRRGGRLVRRYLRKRSVGELEALYQRWGVGMVLVPSILPPPTPFKVFVVSAGLFGVPFRRFFLAVLAGRSIRYFFWGILAVLYGEAAKHYLRENAHAVGTVVTLALLGGLLLLLVVRLRRRAAPGREVV